MDHGVDGLDLVQPQIGGDIGVAGRKVRVVIAGLAVGGRAPIGLHGDNELACAKDRQGEGAVLNRRVVLRSAPGLHDTGADRHWQRLEQPRIVGKRQDRRRLELAQRV